MFCEECGTKNKVGTLYCENCGHKMPVEKKEKTVTIKEKTPMKKSTKTIIGLVSVLVIICIFLYTYFSSVCKPEKVALKYFKAYISNDANALYDTIELDESKFVSKSILKEKLKDKDKIEVSNYSVKKSNIEDDSLTSTVYITYIEKSTKNEKNKTIKLIKSKEKKYLLFDNWIVDSKELVRNDYSVTVPKNSKVTIDGLKLSDKLKTSQSTSRYDYYKIPNILIGKYNVNVVLESGLKLEGEMNVSKYGSFSSNNLSLESKVKSEIEKDAKNKIKLIYDSAIDNKDFEEIKNNFSEDYSDDFENTYNIIKNSVTSEYRKLSSLNLKDLEIKSCVSYDDYIQFNATIKFDYEGTRKIGDDEKEFSKKNATDIVTIKVSLDKNNNEVIGLGSLNTYFY